MCLFYIPNNCSTTEDGPFCLEQHVSYDWQAIAPSTHHDNFLIYNFVDTSSITQKLWPPAVYQAGNTQIRSGRTKCVCGACVGVSESGCGNLQNVCFFSQSYLHGYIPRYHILCQCANYSFRLLSMYIL